MAFESTKAAIKQNKLVASTKVEVLKELDMEFKVDKILSTNYVSRVLSKELQEGKLFITGKTKVDVIAMENGEIKFTMQDVEWSKSVDLTMLGDPIVKICNTVVTFELFERPIVKIDLDIDIKSEILDIIPSIKVDNPEIMLKQQESNVVSVVGNVSNSFTLSQEFEENESFEIFAKRARIDRINVTCGVDAYIIEGKAEVVLCVKNGEKINEVKKEMEFRQEMPFPGLLPTHKIFNNMSVATLMTTVTISEEKTILLIAMDIDDIAFATTDMDIVTLSDAYSVNNMITLSEECLNVINKMDTLKLSKQFTCNIDLGDKLAEEILAVNSIVLSNMQIQGNSVLGDLSLSVIYKDIEGKIEVVNKLEKVSIDGEDLENADLLNSDIVLNSSKVKFGKEIEMNFLVTANVVLKKVSYLVYITEIETSEAYSEEKSPIQVYIVREGEDLFDVGKALRVDVEQIKNQNEDVDNLSVGQKIFVYNKLEANI